MFAAVSGFSAGGWLGSVAAVGVASGPVVGLLPSTTSSERVVSELIGVEALGPSARGEPPGVRLAPGMTGAVLSIRNELVNAEESPGSTGVSAWPTTTSRTLWNPSGRNGAWMTNLPEASVVAVTSTGAP